MDVIECIRRRVSIRKYKSRRIDEQTMFEILDAGRFAPCAGNLQNWKFIVLDQKELIRKIGRATLQPESFENIPYAVVVCSDAAQIDAEFPQKAKQYKIQNVAAAIENILLAATSKGIDSLWVGAFADEIVKSVLHIPEDIDVHAILLFGYRDEQPRPARKKDLAFITYFNKWNEKSNQIFATPVSQHIETMQLTVKETARQAGKALKKATKHAAKKVGRFLKGKK